MCAKESSTCATKDGSGRVALYRATAMTHCYVLECNYNTCRNVHSIPELPAEANDIPNLQKEPTVDPIVTPKFDPSICRAIGRACMVSMLDLFDLNPFSRLPQSDEMTYTRCRAILQKEMKKNAMYDRQLRGLIRRGVISKDGSILNQNSTKGSARNRSGSMSSTNENNKKKNSGNTSVEPTPRPPANKRNKRGISFRRRKVSSNRPPLPPPTDNNNNNNNTVEVQVERESQTEPFIANPNHYVQRLERSSSQSNSLNGNDNDTEISMAATSSISSLSPSSNSKTSLSKSSSKAKSAVVELPTVPLSPNSSVALAKLQRKRRPSASNSNGNLPPCSLPRTMSVPSVSTSSSPLSSNTSPVALSPSASIKHLKSNPSHNQDSRFITPIKSKSPRRQLEEEQESLQRFNSMINASTSIDPNSSSQTAFGEHYQQHHKQAQKLLNPQRGSSSLYNNNNSSNNNNNSIPISTSPSTRVSPSRNRYHDQLRQNGVISSSLSPRQEYKQQQLQQQLQQQSRRGSSIHIHKVQRSQEPLSPDTSSASEGEDESALLKHDMRKNHESQWKSRAGVSMSPIKPSSPSSHDTPNHPQQTHTHFHNHHQDRRHSNRPNSPRIASFSQPNHSRYGNNIRSQNRAPSAAMQRDLKTIKNGFAQIRIANENNRIRSHEQHRTARQPAKNIKLKRPPSLLVRKTFRKADFGGRTPPMKAVPSPRNRGTSIPKPTSVSMLRSKSRKMIPVVASVGSSHHFGSFIPQKRSGLS
eukprot:TRINITY_DN346_c0_g2_i1.p1 TRINITY_DN346_c0_g2~~TRINITY_DN346_c0_g2_i1.p1  ORF type:complete len:805 (-),score=215.29 TRINITY_DN346_c0_g2_i1:102-2369(-)